MDDVTVTNNGATFNSAGKLGGCYSFGTGNSYIIVDSAPLKTFTEFSFACWVKIISWNTNYSTIFAAKNSTAVSWNNLIFSLLRDSSTSALCFNISNGSSYTATSCRTGTLSLNTWYHIACTYKNGQIKLYQDGNVVSIYSTNVIPNFNSIVNLWIGKSNENSYQSNNLLNDVRIYDHALSPLEVKEISKGLILHYPLNRQGWGQENLLPCGGTYTQSSPWTTTLNRTDGYAFVTNSGFEATPGKTYTISVECDGNLYSAHGGTHNPSDKHWTFWAYISNINTTANWQNGGYDTPRNLTSSNNNYRKIGNTHVWTITLTDSQKYIGLRTNSYSNGTDNVTIKWWNMKVEEGDTFTGWSPNSSSELGELMNLNSTIEYDTSGFHNNGTRTGTFSWMSDTPKYQVSTKFNTEPNAISFASKFSHLTTFTYSCWIKTNVSQPAYLLMGYQYGNNTSGSLALEGTQGGFHYYAHAGTSGDVTIKGSVNCCDNQWHMITATYDGSKVIVYIDGTKTAEGAVTLLTTARTFSLNYPSGASGRYFNGLLSDARVYATALSAEDVKSLYNNSAYIDNQGNIYGAVYEEV